MNWPLLKDRQLRTLTVRSAWCGVTSKNTLLVKNTVLFRHVSYTLDTWKARTQIAPYISSFQDAQQPLDHLWTADVEPTVTRQYRSPLEMIYGVELGFCMHILMKPRFSFMDETSCVCACLSF